VPWAQPAHAARSAGFCRAPTLPLRSAPPPARLCLDMYQALLTSCRQTYYRMDTPSQNACLAACNMPFSAALPIAFTVKLLPQHWLPPLPSSTAQAKHALGPVRLGRRTGWLIPRRAQKEGHFLQKEAAVEKGRRAWARQATSPCLRTPSHLFSLDLYASPSPIRLRTPPPSSPHTTPHHTPHHPPLTSGRAGRQGRAG